MMDAKTMHIDLFIPPGDHTLQIKELEGQPNYHFVYNDKFAITEACSREKLSHCVM